MPRALRSDVVDISIVVDMITGPPGTHPPFGEINVLCNGLMLDKGEFRLMPCISASLRSAHEKFTMVQSII